MSVTLYIVDTLLGCNAEAIFTMILLINHALLALVRTLLCILCLLLCQCLDEVYYIPSQWFDRANLGISKKRGGQ